MNTCPIFRTPLKILPVLDPFEALKWKYNKVVKVPMRIMIEFMLFSYPKILMDKLICGRIVPVTAPPTAVAAPIPTNAPTAGLPNLEMRGEILIIIMMHGIEMPAAKIISPQLFPEKGRMI
jgi:hypothetical protein